LTSNQTTDIKDAKSLGLFVVISCHTVDDAKRAEFLGADMITYSPIFDTPNKGKPLGVDAISRLREEIDIPIIALGGIIEQKEIDAVMSRGASGFASIRYFG
jgi:thiamine-phosphate pyrophosphorylase